MNRLKGLRCLWPLEAVLIPSASLSCMRSVACHGAITRSSSPFGAFTRSHPFLKSAKSHQESKVMLKKCPESISHFFSRSVSLPLFFPVLQEIT